MQSDKTKLFISKARKVHGNRYDYSRVEYVTNKIKVELGCGLHGWFNQTPDNHLSGQGCLPCGYDRLNENRRIKSEKNFISKSSLVHKGKYEYYKVVYVNNQAKVTIICPKHGEFKQTPKNHARGQGCPECKGNKRYDNESFIARSSVIHGGKYDYGKVSICGARNKVIITCPEHGDFRQPPTDHISGRGCPHCGSNWDRSKPTYLYILRAEGIVKIGITIDVERRVKRQEKSQGFTSEICYKWHLSNFDTAREVEKRTHDNLNDRNANLSGFDGATEWFKVTPKEAVEAVFSAMCELGVEPVTI